MRTGDYFCIEDTNPLIPVNLGDGCIQQEEEFVQVAVGTDLLEEVKRFLVAYDIEEVQGGLFLHQFLWLQWNMELAWIYSLHAIGHVH